MNKFFILDNIIKVEKKNTNSHVGNCIAANGQKGPQSRIFWTFIDAMLMTFQRWTALF